MIEAEQFTRTLTGYDEIAIAQQFGAPLGALAGGLVPRALLFIESRRGGMKDPDAYMTVMTMTLGDVEERFEKDPKAGTTETVGTSGSPTS